MQILSLSCDVLLHLFCCIFVIVLVFSGLPPIDTIIKKKMRFLKIFPYFVIFYCFFTKTFVYMRFLLYLCTVNRYTRTFLCLRR